MTASVARKNKPAACPPAKEKALINQGFFLGG
jgi:hypothetical protein